ncbi:hypothetical protein [Aquimarina macrocephali]|uniref:hypothetical protein n=1 Tax=Aquimarina macrocephali TaxID=666563 RepID=UPI0004667EEE|nr:hypothetical protein [Aquimarina macrocephali]
MWSTIQDITTPIALVAFIIAVILKAYQIKLKAKNKKIASIPSKERSNILESEVFGIHLQNQLNTLGLTKTQRFKIAQEIISQRIQKLKIYFKITITLGILLLTLILGIYIIDYFKERYKNKKTSEMVSNMMTQLSKHQEEKIGKEKLFGEQLIKFNRISELINAPSEIEFIHRLGYTEIIEKNLNFLIDDFFHYKFETDKPDISAFGEKVYFWTLDNIPLIGNDLPDGEVIPKAGYKVKMRKEDPNFIRLTYIYISNDYVQHYTELSQLNSSPFMTKETKCLLGEYLYTIENNLTIIGVEINNLITEIDLRYSTVEDIKMDNREWAYNIIISKLTPIKPKADAINIYFNEKWNIEGI